MLGKGNVPKTIGLVSGAFDKYMNIFDNVDILFCEGCFTVVIIELFDGKK